MGVGIFGTLGVQNAGALDLTPGALARNHDVGRHGTPISFILERQRCPYSIERGTGAIEGKNENEWDAEEGALSVGTLCSAMLGKSWGWAILVDRGRIEAEIRDLLKETFLTVLRRHRETRSRGRSRGTTQTRYSWSSAVGRSPSPTGMC